MASENVMIEVSDGNPTVPRLRNVQIGDEGGRGLYLVSVLGSPPEVRRRLKGGAEVSVLLAR